MSRLLSIANVLKRRPLYFLLLLAAPAAAVAAILAVPAMRDTAGSAPVAVSPMQIGVNVGGVSYYSGERAFMNLAQGSAWGSLPGGELFAPSRLDEYGMVTALKPGETATKLLVPPEGAYYGARPVRIRCAWQGKGSLQPGLSAMRISYGRNSFEFDWPPANAPKADIVNIQLLRTDPSDPVRRIDCREKTASPTALFSPQFLELLAGYKVLRFVDWQNVNANAPITWATRARPEGENLSNGAGVSVEHMVALSNAVGADAWFTMPWNADEDYTRRFATYVRDNLVPGHKVYVEVGNEVWNWGFRATAQARDEGLAEGLSKDQTEALLWRYAEKSTEIFKIWSEVFKATPDRLVRVMAFQNGGVWGMEKSLAFRDTAQHVDAIASAPYFGYAAFKDQRATLTDLDAIFVHLDADIDAVLTKAVEMKVAAARYGKRYIGYEAGQHVVNADNVDLLVRISRDPRMQDAYRKYLSEWRKRIGDVVALYSSHGVISRFGAWGMREYAGQPLSETPKRRAVNEFLQAPQQTAAQPSETQAQHK